MAANWEIRVAAHLAFDMFSKYKYLIVNLVFPTSFPDYCLFVPFDKSCHTRMNQKNAKTLALSNLFK